MKAANTVHGSPGGLGDLTAVTTEYQGSPMLDGLLPLNPRSPRRSGTRPSRSATRNAAERRAMKRLKLLHLGEWNALLSDELAREGHTPQRTRPLDDHLRNLASRRLMALTERSGNG